VYIGQTVNLARRLRQHAKAPPGRMSVDMGGGEVQTAFAALVDVATLESRNMTGATADLLEKDYIEQMGALDVRRGYNTLPAAPGRSSSFWARKGWDIHRRKLQLQKR